MACVSRVRALVRVWVDFTPSHSGVGCTRLGGNGDMGVVEHDLWVNNTRISLYGCMGVPVSAVWVHASMSVRVYGRAGV